MADLKSSHSSSEHRLFPFRAASSNAAFSGSGAMCQSPEWRLLCKKTATQAFRKKKKTATTQKKIPEISVQPRNGRVVYFSGLFSSELRGVLVPFWWLAVVYLARNSELGTGIVLKQVIGIQPGVFFANFYMFYHEK